MSFLFGTLNAKLKDIMTKLNQDSSIQEKVSLTHFRHLNDVLRCKIAIAKNKINLYVLPDWFAVDVDPDTGKYSDSRYFVTANKKWLKANKHRNPAPQQVTYVEMQRFIKARIVYDEQWLEELAAAYDKKMAEYPNYEPEELEVIKDSYGLKHDYVNESMKSSWDYYQERTQELDRLEKILDRLEDPLTREDTLHRMRPRYTQTQENDDDLYEEALSIIARTQIASTSFLQHHLSTGYTKASMLMNRLEDNGIISGGDGINKRTVLINEDGSKREDI